MEKALSYLTVLPSNYSEMSTFVEKVLAEIDEENPFKVKAQLVAIKKTIELIEAGMNETLIREAAKYPEKKFKLFGVEFEKSSKTTYSYDHSEAYNKLDLKLKNWQRLMKLASTPIADAVTGELIEPAHSKTTEFIKVSLNQQ